MNQKPVFGLVCAGGGAHGAYQVGVLKYIHEKFCNGSKSPFQIFAGSSCGALNTSFYAAESAHARESRLLLEELWLSFHIPAYHGSIFKNAFISLYKEWRKDPDDRRSAWALLDPRPMQQIVQKGFLRNHLLEAFRQESTLGVGIAATEVLTGRACWFLEGSKASAWDLFHSVGILDKLTPQHLYASCSVPIFFPPVKLGDYYFLDGSISLGHPLSAAISMGANRILSIATDKPVPAKLPTYAAGFKPRFSNVVRLLLNRLSHDSAREEAEELNMFNRFYRALSRRNRHLKRRDRDAHLPLFHNEARPSQYRPTEVFLLFPSIRIRETTGIMEEEMPRGSGSRKRTRFMFHEKFIKNLIGLGYQDAGLRHAELQEFFLPQTTKRKWMIFPRRRKKLPR